MPIQIDEKNMKYSELKKKELVELAAKLEAKNDGLKKEIKDLETTLTREENADQAAPDQMDRSSFEEQTQRSQIVLAGKKRLQIEVAEAIARIENGTYGVCDDTEEPIGFKRLSAQPWTRLSLEAQQDLEDARNNARGNGGGDGFPAGY